MKAIINGRIVTKDEVIDNGIIVFDNKICQLAHNIDVSGCEIYDAKGNYVIPGLVDLHTHGFCGDDVCDADINGLRRMAVAIAKNGVTSWCPTTMTVEKANIISALDTIRKLKTNPIGAKVLGANVEGPFINPTRKGAQAEENILTPDADFALENKDVIKLITVAPEMDGGLDFVEKVTSNSDITVSIGHTDADYECAKKAIEKGARHITHLFNAMTPLHHLQPGVIGAAFEDDRVSCELIADTFHVKTALYKMLTRNKKDKMVLITDCIRAGGMPDGEYTLGGQPVTVKGIECRLKDGTVAGSVLTLNKAVYNFMHNSDVSIVQAVNMASLNPAMVVGEEDTIGSLEVGKCADIVIADDEMNVIKTFINGDRI